MKALLAIILFFCFIASVFASTPYDFSKPLTAEECVKIALEQSPSIIEARATVSEASAGRQSAWSGLVPQVSGQGS
jgi:outer membrane protein TolC